MSKFKLGDKVIVKGTSYLGHIASEPYEYGEYEVMPLGDNKPIVLRECDLSIFRGNSESKERKEKDFVSIANEIGEFTQMKNGVYGSSVDATHKIMEVLMERYLNTKTDKYEFPRSLLKHMLLQVRIMDKQNRIFNNPDGDKLGESGYRDLTGYGLIGIEMDERNSK